MKTIMMMLAGLVLSTSIPANAADDAIGTISIVDPVVRAMLPGQRTGGGYLTIRNAGVDNDVFLGGTSDRARYVEPHKMTMDNDVMVMRPMKDGIRLGPGETIALVPGGDHLMFVGVERPFEPGETISATLRFEKAGSINVQFQVVSIGASSGAGAMKMEGGAAMTGDQAAHANHAQ